MCLVEGKSSIVLKIRHSTCVFLEFLLYGIEKKRKHGSFLKDWRGEILREGRIHASLSCYFINFICESSNNNNNDGTYIQRLFRGQIR